MNSKTRKIRFAADSNALIWILDESTGEEVMGLLVNESLTGCGAVVRENPIIVEGQSYSVKAGELSPFPATLRWVKTIDEGVLRLGFEYNQQ